MMLSICGAVVSTIGTDSALIIRSDDGRAIEVPYVLNGDGVIVEILAGKNNPNNAQIVLPIPPGRREKAVK